MSLQELNPLYGTSTLVRDSDPVEDRFEFLSFKLDPEFVGKYSAIEPDWGFKLPTGDSLSELTFVMKYSRELPGGGKERWYQCCERVINGTFSILLDYCIENNINYYMDSLIETAEEAYDRMFKFKWTPPGRGLWSMGTEAVHKLGKFGQLQNCSFVSTKDIDENVDWWFAQFMDICMAGVGVGFDTRGVGKVSVHEPVRSETIITIDDSKEGWAESTQQIISAFIGTGELYQYDYSDIRPPGAPISSGGIAPGPTPLIKLHEKLIDVLGRSIGTSLTSRLITDICNLIGKGVVAGGVRRCLREGTIVQTFEGPKNIEEIKIGDLVSTINGWQPVLDSVAQGYQDCVRVRHQDGWLDCTPDHRVAVMQSTDGSYIWVQAQDLKPDDRLMFVRNVSPGEPTALPGWSYLRPAHSTTSIDIAIPELDEEMAWLIGLIHGNGYVYTEKNNEGHVKKGAVSISCSTLSNRGIIDRAKANLERFGVNVIVRETTGNWVNVSTSSNQLASYMEQHVKQPKTTIEIPFWIKTGTEEIRLAYLAGIFDSDGTADNRPKILVTTCYERFAKEIQNLCYSLGFEMRLKAAKDQPSRPDHWQRLYNVCFISLSAQEKFNKINTVKEFGKVSKIPQSGNGFPTSMVKAEFKNMKGLGAGNAQINIDAFERLLHPENNIVPIKVLDVSPLGNFETYDITVEDQESFVADGVLVHNTALISLGTPSDEDFVSIKDWNLPQNAERMGPDGWGWTSNNTVFVDEKTDLSPLIERIKINGEPGLYWLDTMRKNGRTNKLNFPIDNLINDNAIGVNPCAEIPLCDNEACTLVELYLPRAESLEDFKRSAKMAFLYGKIITLAPVQWESFHQIMASNRRIGCSISGLTQFVESHPDQDSGFQAMTKMMDETYKHIRIKDAKWSSWLKLPESIRVTTVKPSGTVSIVAGVTPGVHWPVASGEYIRRIRFANHDPILEVLNQAGYDVEQDRNDPDHTSVVSFPVVGPRMRPERSAPLDMKIKMAVLAQQWWADNMVSATFTFLEEEQPRLETLINDSIGKLKVMSFLPLKEEATYPQQPYESVPHKVFENLSRPLKSLDWSQIYKTALDSDIEQGCTNDTCELVFTQSSKTEASEL